MSTKDTVLELFERNRGFFISGEKIAADLGISRTAVWKAVKKLQSEGYEIEAITNRGYCLAKNSDVLSVQGLRSYFDENCSGLRPEVFVTVDSTNNVCMKKASHGEGEGYVAIAGAQTKGRGRRGRSFFSPADTGIYMSILLKPVSYPGRQVLRLTSMAAVAVCEAIEKLSGKQASIKWVNDVLIDGKKVCGILSEASYDLEDARLDSVIVGIGINAYAPKGGFPSDIAGKAGSVFDHQSSGKRNQLAAEVLNRFMSYYLSDSTEDHIEAYRERSFLIGKDIEISRNDTVRKAHVLGLDENCGLIVRLEDGSETVLIAGEVSVAGIDS